MTEITEFSKDGWPLCPQCGEDQLRSHKPVVNMPYVDDFHVAPDVPVQEYIDAGMVCAQCGWRKERTARNDPRMDV